MTKVSKAEFSRIRGVTRAAVTIAIKKGIIEQEPDGKLILEKASLQWDANTDPTKKRNYTNKENRPDPNKAQEDWNVSRARRESALATLAELELAEKQESVLNAEETETTIIELCRTTRDRILGIPKRVAPMVAGLDDERKIARLIHDELETALKGLTVEGFKRKRAAKKVVA